MKALELCRAIADTIGGCEPTCTVGGSYETSVGDWQREPPRERYLAVMVDADKDGNALCVAVSGQLDCPVRNPSDFPYALSALRALASLTHRRP